MKKPRSGGEELVTKVHDQQLRGKRLSCCPSRALALTSSTFGASGHVEQLFPAELLDRAGSKGRVLAQLLGVHGRSRPQRAECPRLAREGDIDGGKEDVKMLRIHHED